MHASSSSTSIGSRQGSPAPDGSGLRSRRNSWNRSHDALAPQPVFDHPLASHSPTSMNYIPPAPGPSYRAPVTAHDDYDPRQSRTSLDSPLYQNLQDPEDVHLTSFNPSDPEASPRSPARRKQGRYADAYSDQPSSTLARSSATLRAFSKSIRRVSQRAINFRGFNLDAQSQHMRLPEDIDGMPSRQGAASGVAAGGAHPGFGQVVDEPEHSDLQDAAEPLRLRGTTLGIFTAQSRTRNFIFNILVWRWTEPIVLLLIITDAVMLSLQARRALLPAEGGAVPVKGYFHTWEDWVIFVLFVIFTIELMARALVSGLVLDPDVPTSRLITNLATVFNPGGKAKTRSMPPTPSRTQSGLTRGGSLREGSAGAPVVAKTDIVSRFDRSWSHVAAPFALRHEGGADFDSVSRQGAASHARMTSASRQAGSKSIPSSHSKSFSTSSGISQLWSIGGTPGAVSNSDLHAAGIKPVYKSLPFVLSIARQHSLAERGLPYLRHSWNRIDAIAVFSFWAAFALSIFGVERADNFHISIFRALSVLRCARLLAVTRGTTTIMHSLKIARPLLANVAYFVLFAMILFSVIGVQSFRGSLRRSCVLLATPLGPNITLDQTCGGHVDPLTMDHTGYITRLGLLESNQSKGYVCPLGQLCIEHDENPHQNIQSFDDIAVSALQIMVIASANTWAPVMYSAIDAEEPIVSLFFIVALIVLNFWLINLFVAVITNTFAGIRTETTKSAFGADTNAGGLLPDVAELVEDQETKGRMRTQSLIRSAYIKSRYLWILLILLGVAFQGMRRPDISEMELHLMDRFEMGITFAFALEIVWRFVGFLPDWRSFFRRSPGNLIDTGLVLSTLVLQLPVVKNNPVYPWLTILQLLRFYRVILVVPRMRPLLLSVFGNTAGLLNMTIFLLLTNFIAALFAVQIFRGVVPEDVQQNFSQLWLSYIAMYQVLSSENWTDVMYATSEAETPYKQAIISAIFITGWFFFANFILVQLFIAVINENFQVAEEIKQGRQFDRFRQKAEPEEARLAWLERINPYKWFRPAPESVNISDLGHNALPIRMAVIQHTGIDASGASDSRRSRTGAGRTGWFFTLLRSLQSIIIGDNYATSDEVPLKQLRRQRNRGSATTEIQDENEKHLDILAAAVNTESAREVDSLSDQIFEAKALKADFIHQHPSYDRSLWLLSQSNPIRKFFQWFVMPSRGERIFGQAPSPFLDMLFRLFLFGVVIAGLSVAGTATPYYRREHFLEHGFDNFAWFNYAEAAFGFVLVLEFAIKVIADGFVFTPNGYLLSLWNCVDFFIMLASIANIVDSLSVAGGLSRFTRASKAFRALKLITLVHTLRETFQSLIFAGALRILDAAMLAVLYMIPYAVWGLNIFSGKLFRCNDDGVSSKAECVDEFTYTPFDDQNYGYLVPRVWENPTDATEYSFDSFQASFLILFEIVSLEGWVDVMAAAMSITGPDQQPRQNASQVNAIFFLSYILLGALIILTLFISIIIGNFSVRSGIALLTQEQREWIDLQKLIKRQKPSRRPTRPQEGFRRWCYERAVNKHGFWSRMMTFIFVAHIGALMSLNYTVSVTGDNVRDVFFLGVTTIYTADIVIRFLGLGWASFKANGWNLFDCFVVVGGGGTTIIALGGFRISAAQQLQKLFLVLIAFKLVQKSNSLNQLFKTAVASLPAIGKLMALWLCLFLFYAVLYLEVFGLTRWGGSETRMQNYSSLGRAITMLAFMSTGEGWNAYMHDFTVEYPACTEASADNRVSDCGSVAWSYTLFISWNILSMFIFVNMFTGVVVENFSYVFQSSGGAKSLNREEMRAFKKVWTEFASPRTKLLPRQKFADFFGKLSGVFEVRIYRPENRIPAILDKASYTDDDYQLNPNLPHADKHDAVNIQRLKRILGAIDYSSVKAKRMLYCRVYHEACLIDKKEGMDFTRMLTLLAHHKLVNDDRALELKDLLVRKAVMAEVMDHVRLDKVRSLLRMIVQRRKFLHEREQRLQTSVPNIVIDDEVRTPSTVTLDITQGVDLRDTPRSTYYITDDGGVSPPLSPHSPRGLHSPGATGRGRLSNVSMLSDDTRHFSRDNSPQRNTIDPDDPVMLSSMHQSGWSTMLDDEDEDRR